MATRRQNAHTSQNNSVREAAEPTASVPEGHTVPQRPIWEIVVEIGAEIPDEMWATIPDDASINYKHYLYGVPKKPA